MATVNILTDREVSAAIESASKDKIAITVTLQHQDRWIMFTSDILETSGGFIWITYPQNDSGAGQAHEFSTDQRIGVTFLCGHQRFLFSTEIASVEDTEARRVQLKMPDEIQVSQRRADSRVEMPALAMVEASIWLGGTMIKCDEPDTVTPVWSGAVVDLCQGGCYVRTNSDISQYIEAGDVVGLKLTLGDAQEAEQILIDAQFCRSDPEADMLMVGLKFIDSDDPGQSCEIYEKIKTKLREFQG
ncbi:MAG: flagellar brake protein [bacterium]|nr:flagellar brake protein [bacterium]